MSDPVQSDPVQPAQSDSVQLTQLDSVQSTQPDSVQPAQLDDSVQPATLDDSVQPATLDDSVQLAQLDDSVQPAQLDDSVQPTDSQSIQANQEEIQAVSMHMSESNRLDERDDEPEERQLSELEQAMVDEAEDDADEEEQHRSSDLAPISEKSMERDGKEGSSHRILDDSTWMEDEDLPMEDGADDPAGGSETNASSESLPTTTAEDSTITSDKDAHNGVTTDTEKKPRFEVLKKNKPDAASDKNKLFIGGIGPKCTKEHFHDFFQAYGEVTDCFCIAKRGFGFVSFATEEALKAVLAKHEAKELLMEGRNLDVKVAVPRDDLQNPSRQKEKSRRGSPGRTGKRIITTRSRRDTHDRDSPARDREDRDRRGRETRDREREDRDRRGRDAREGSRSSRDDHRDTRRASSRESRDYRDKGSSSAASSRESRDYRERDYHSRDKESARERDYARDRPKEYARDSRDEYRDKDVRRDTRERTDYARDSGTKDYGRTKEYNSRDSARDKDYSRDTREQSRDFRDRDSGRDSREFRAASPVRGYTRDYASTSSSSLHETRDRRYSDRDTRDTRDPRDTLPRDSRDARDGRDPRSSRDARDGRDTRTALPRDVKDYGSSRDAYGVSSSQTDSKSYASRDGRELTRDPHDFRRDSPSRYRDVSQRDPSPRLYAGSRQQSPPPLRDVPLRGGSSRDVLRDAPLSREAQPPPLRDLQQLPLRDVRDAPRQYESQYQREVYPKQAPNATVPSLPLPSLYPPRAVPQYNSNPPALPSTYTPMQSPYAASMMAAPSFKPNPLNQPYGTTPSFNVATNPYATPSAAFGAPTYNAYR